MKKEKLTINSLAMGNLKRRKKQYAIMIISIILAMIFSSGIVFFIFSSYETGMAQYSEKYGDQQVIVTVYGDERVYEKAVEDGVLSDYGFAHIIGFGYAEEENIGTPIGWLDDKAKGLLNQSLIEGVYPVQEDEIAVEQAALKELAPNAKLGDEIILNVKVQNGSEYYATKEKSYKLVGILKDKKSNQSGLGWDDEFIPAAFVAPGTLPEAGGKEALMGYCAGYENFGLYLEALQVEYLVNYSDFSIGRPELLYYPDSLFAGSVVILLVFASCVAIVNSFNTNLKERKKQIGMLRAVGATKRQIVKIFSREALIISLICTPISIAISYAIVWGLLTLIGEGAIMTKSLGVLLISAAVCVVITMLSALIPLSRASRVTPMQAIRNIENNRKMHLKKIKSEKSFDVSAHLAKRNARLYKGGRVAVSIILVVTILFSALCFSYINYQRSNVDAFGHDYEIFMFHSFSDYGYENLEFGNRIGMSEADKRELDSYPYFSKVSAEKGAVGSLEVDEISDYLLTVSNIKLICENGLRSVLNDTDGLKYETFLKDIYNVEADGKINSEDYEQAKTLYGFSKEAVPIYVRSFEDSTIKALEKDLTQGKIDFEKLASGEEIILVAPKTAKLTAQIAGNGKDYNTKVVCDTDSVEKGYSVICEGESPYKVGDTLNISFIRNLNPEMEEHEFIKEEKEVTVGAIISPRNVPTDMDCGSFSVITTHAGMTEIFESARYGTIDMDLAESVELTDETDDEIMAFLSRIAEKYGSYPASNLKLIQSRKEDVKSILATVLSMTIIAFAICAAIVNNSLTASIREKKKEIGTLRAVGADIKTLVKSYILQLLSMLGLGYGIGFGAFGIAYFAIWQIETLIWSDESYLYEPEFIFSPWETVAFCVILFAICSINLWSKVRKEMKNSIVENIKEL